ncbi:hypothetical protein SBA2_10029 [Acidobacteriia bacterium SbA2]|nr:hypothetical protein SBA2_10029 [Acidobacteriia bacterium SbA2]
MPCPAYSLTMPLATIPSPPRGRGWTAAGAFFSRCGTGQGVRAKLDIAKNNVGHGTRERLRANMLSI